MKIGILLPYKENFSPEYPGAVSLFVNETSLKSEYKNSITVFGNTNYKKKFKLRYKNIDLFNNPLRSQTKAYVNYMMKAIRGNGLLYVLTVVNGNALIGL